MNSTNKYLIIIFFVVFIAMFLLPSLTTDSFNKLILLYSYSDDIKADVANSQALDTMKYIFKVDIFLELFSKVIGALSLIGLLYQFSREKNIKEAELVLDINTNFLSNPDIKRIYIMLEESKNVGHKINPFSEKDIIDMANYLSFFEPFYELIQRKVISFPTIDQLAYRFFLAVNNKHMQEMLLCKSGKEIAWKDLYKLHYLWKKYRDGDVWQGEIELSHYKIYPKIIEN